MATILQGWQPKKVKIQEIVNVSFFDPKKVVLHVSGDLQIKSSKFIKYQKVSTRIQKKANLKMYFMCFYLLCQGDLVTCAFSLYLGDSQIIRESWHRCPCFNSTSSIYILYHHSNHIFLWFICPFQEIVTHTTRWQRV